MNSCDVRGLVNVGDHRLRINYAAPMYRAKVLGPMRRISRGPEAQVRDVADARSPERG